MSEYQYYEFLAVDRPLSPEDLAYVRTLSRRVEPTPTHAVFTYSYGGFPGDPLKLLAKHYDALLYLANWGSKQLAFRFPQPASTASSRRTYAAIVNAREEVRRQRLERERQEAERLRLARLDALAKREEQVWAQVPAPLARRTASSYDEAVAHLAELQDLTIHRKQGATFDARLKNVLAPYATSAALQRRLRAKGLG